MKSVGWRRTPSETERRVGHPESRRRRKRCASQTAALRRRSCRLWIRPVGFIVFKVFRKWFAPAGPLDQGCASLKPPNPFHLYPYWHLLCLRWFSSRATFERTLYNLSAERLIAEKKTPMLFMYGVEKRNKFHTDKIVELVRATPGCKVVPVANAGHWLYHESQQAELCFREVKAFVLGK